MAEWRAGRSTGRTLWRDEQLVGMVDSPELAAEIVETMNRVAALLDEVRNPYPWADSDTYTLTVPAENTWWNCCGFRGAEHPDGACPADAERRSEATPQNDLLGPSRVDPYDTTHGGITEP